VGRERGKAGQNPGEGLMMAFRGIRIFTKKNWRKDVRGGKRKKTSRSKNDSALVVNLKQMRTRNIDSCVSASRKCEEISFSYRGTVISEKMGEEGCWGLEKKKGNLLGWGLVWALVGLGSGFFRNCRMGGMKEKITTEKKGNMGRVRVRLIRKKILF